MSTPMTSTQRLAAAARTLAAGLSLVAGLFLGTSLASASTLIPAVETGGSGPHVSVAAEAPTPNALSIMLVEGKEGPATVDISTLRHGPSAF